MPYSLNGLSKRVGDFVKNGPSLQQLETSPFVSASGQVCTITFQRTWAIGAASAGLGLIVRDFHSGAVLASPAWPGMFGSVFQDGADINILGVSSVAAGNQIIWSTLDADLNPSPPIPVYTAPPGRVIYNQKITASPLGYVMVIEMDCADVHFMSAASLAGPWAPVGLQFRPGQYNGCPTIEYQTDGFYYITYLGEAAPGVYNTWAARTADLSSFQFSGVTLLAPDFTFEGSNASDFKYVEAGGVTYYASLDGDQATWANIRTGTFQGTPAQMFACMF